MKIVISVDTEPSIAGYFKNPQYHPLIDEPIACQINGKSEGLGFLTSLFQKYDFMATFFVETVHNHYFSSDKMEKYVHHLLEAKQDVQLHLHPIWQYFKDKTISSDDCSDYSREFLIESIAHGKDYIKQWSGQDPVALRTGRFSVSNNVYAAMEKANINIASNICVACFKPQEKNLNLTHGIHKISNIIEIPATCFHDRALYNWNGFRPLQVTAVGAYEMTHTLDQMQKNGHQVAMIVTHPFEFIKKSDFRYNNMRINKIVQKRMEHLCQFLAYNSDRFQVVPISEAAKIPIENLAPPALGNPFLSFSRAVTNFINDRI